MYLLEANRNTLLELGFTEAYYRSIGSYNITYCVIITPALYMMILLKFEEEISLRRVEDNKKSLVIADGKWFYRRDDYYKDLVKHIENNELEVVSLLSL